MRLAALQEKVVNRMLEDSIEVEELPKGSCLRVVK